MHKEIKKMFVMLGSLVLLLAVEGVIFEQTKVLPYIFRQVSQSSQCYSQFLSVLTSLFAVSEMATR